MSTLHVKGEVGGVSERPAPLISLLRLLEDRSTEHYISNSKNELMNDPTLIM